MGIRMKGGSAIGLVMCLFAGPVLAANADQAALRKDLTSVIALLGLPCGSVVNVIPKGKDDNIAVCSDGNRYRVYINADGRVVAKKQ